MNFLAIIMLAIKWAPTIKAIWDAAWSNQDALKKVEALAPEVGDLLSHLGGMLFPKAAPELQRIGAIVAHFDPNVTKWLQGSMNSALGIQLVVDGIYGPATIAAVEQLQMKLGVPVDGIFGQITQVALNTLLAKK